MNFFGHCVVASWVTSSPEFALGAMLPDLAQMIGQRRIRSREPLLGQGIAFHHRTDAVFHDSPTFVRLQRQARQTLQGAGVARGPSLAVAHVGLEILLDAQLSTEPRYLEHYRQALTSLEPSRARTALDWGHFEGDPWADFERLRRTLLRERARLVPDGAEQLFARLSRVLAGRPKLALHPEHGQAVVAWATTAMQHVGGQLDGWLTELRDGLRLPSPETPVNVARPSPRESR